MQKLREIQEQSLVLRNGVGGSRKSLAKHKILKINEGPCAYEKAILMEDWLLTDNVLPLAFSLSCIKERGRARSVAGGDSLLLLLAKRCKRLGKEAAARWHPKLF